MLEEQPPQNPLPKQLDLAGLEKIENEERPFTLEEATAELNRKMTEGVTLKKEIEDIAGNKWPKETAGRVVNKKKLKEGGYALVILPTDQSSQDTLNHTHPSIVVKSIKEYKEFFSVAS